ncbi:urea carboxylase-associated family protein [Terrabacter aeriphilus]|uniref:Urea carboxylase-associated family protein n=1 Tax=Terrabacter aeriphilus TaxID=515662 RepID=A0ABP9JHY4_9MICO
MTISQDTGTGSTSRLFGPGGPVLQPAGGYRDGMDLTRLDPQTGTAFVLRAGQLLTVVDPTGEQVSDFFAVMEADRDEWLSSGRTIDYANSTSVTTGRVLYSNRSNPMATVVEDTCGHHDLLLTPCSQQTFDLLYPELEGAYHPSCFENLATNLAGFGVDPDRISTTLNIFMNVWAERNGELHIDPPTSRAGDRFVLRAEADLVVGLTACSAEKSNNGVCKPIDYRIDG